MRSGSLFVAGAQEVSEECVSSGGAGRNALQNTYKNDDAPAQGCTLGALDGCRGRVEADDAYPGLRGSAQPRGRVSEDVCGDGADGERKEIALEVADARVYHRLVAEHVYVEDYERGHEPSVA